MPATGEPTRRRAGPRPAPTTWEHHGGAASAPLRYRRREPEKTLLHAVVRERLESFLAQARERSSHGRGLPAFVERDLRALEESEDEALAALQAAEVDRRLRYPDPFPNVRRSSFLEGFSLHAGVRIHENDREGRERLARYVPCTVRLALGSSIPSLRGWQGARHRFQDCASRYRTGRVQVTLMWPLPTP